MDLDIRLLRAFRAVADARSFTLDGGRRGGYLSLRLTRTSAGLNCPGAVCGYASEHTAFALRRPGYCRRVFAAWREPAQAEIATAWVKRVSAALEPFFGGAAYLNYLTQRDSDQGVRVAYGSNLERLASLKSKYDPSNFFNSNRNIQPMPHAHV